MKTTFKYAFFYFLVTTIFSCNGDKTPGAIRETNKDDYYQMRGYGDSIPNDSMREVIRKDSIRIYKGRP
jgi:hypothetical protein